KEGSQLADTFFVAEFFGMLLICKIIVKGVYGIDHFGFHSQVGYFWMFLAVTHLIQTWVRVKAFVRNRFRERSSTNPQKECVSRILGNPASTLLQPSKSANLASSSVSVPASATAESSNRMGRGRRNLLLVILAIATGIGFDHWVTPSKTEDSSAVETDLGLRYHRWSQPGYGEAIDTLLNWGQKPPLYKTYPDASQIDLPQPHFAKFDGNSEATSEPTLDLVTAVTNRRSRRNYNTRSYLSLEHLSQLLFLSQGITGGDLDFRSVPSSGALYPLEIYPIVHRVSGLEPGLYHHAIQHHKLELVKPGDLRQPLIKAGLNQEFLGKAHVCFVVSGIFQRTRWKYHERTYRYVLMEVGHLGQNLYLAATALGLGVCGIGAFLDDPLNQLLGIDGREEAAFYLVTVGEVT
ncbi:MAG: SagB/ThcOx family dehydrogenase, partial [Leptolyngbya sp. SIO1D8]|nr:SagB/ThcOx family dehydrogenase [Leptolyngbya sp. SIO1D8]